MVLGLRTKSRKAASVQVDYVIHLQEIKPWPPSQSLKSLRSVLLQWENGDRSFGSTGPVVPSLGEGRIEFNESFRLHVTLLKETSSRGKDNSPFQKNLLELNLYEPRRDKTVKGHLLGSMAVDLAEHGVIKEAMTIRAPVNCKRSFRNSAQPVLYIKIQQYDDGSSSSSRDSLSKEASLDRDVKESVSVLMTEEYAEEAEIASFTDDDVSSHSSFAHHSSLEAAADSQLLSSPGNSSHHEDVSAEKQTGEVGNLGTDLPSEPAKPELEPVMKPATSYGAEVHQNGGLHEPSASELSVDPESWDNGNTSLISSPRSSSMLVLQKSDISGIHSTSCVTCEVTEEEIISSKIEKGVDKGDLIQGVLENMIDLRGKGNLVKKFEKKENDFDEILNRVEPLDTDLQKEKLDLASIAKPKHNVNDRKAQEGYNESDEFAISHGAFFMSMEGNTKQKWIENGSEEKNREYQSDSVEVECLTNDLNHCSAVPVEREVNTSVVRQPSHLQNPLRKQLSSDMTTFSQRVLGERINRTLTSDRLKNMRFSMRSTPDALESITYSGNVQYMEDVKEIDVQEDVPNGSMNYRPHDQETVSLSSDNAKHVSRTNRSSFLDSKVQELEHKVEMLQGELREAAAIEIGIYSVIAEHGISPHKVHTPARRLSRLYVHALKHSSPEKRASAAKSSVCGLVLVAKACGNDVPRLTFWLSNLVVLRAIISQLVAHSENSISADSHPSANSSRVMPKKKSSLLKWESRKKEKFSSSEHSDDWEDPNAFITALERIETWIFSRIVESIWWQTLAPHMQPISHVGAQNVVSNLKTTYEKMPSLGSQQQESSSIDIWKKAFKDACEKLCPVKGGGHYCGCMPMLARLVMEQCVARLDVAMFNAMLRESDDEILTDPVSDPISDSRVLPVTSEIFSFGTGAQLKNAIGKLSRCLTDLFGMDADDCPENENDQDDGRLDVAASLKSFHFLNALSDLLMLPKDMLLEGSIRKEVCPTFNASTIKRILDRFSPDEFCPDPIPDAVLEALDSEDPLESNDESVRNFPCNASPVVYSPPSSALIRKFIGEVESSSLLKRSRSSVVRKCHTSDDELDELESPLLSIFHDKSYTPNAKLKENNCTYTVRYQLLQEVWRDDE